MLYQTLYEARLHDENFGSHHAHVDTSGYGAG
jgi:hypothetical protein